jgi:hypothetical protein
MLRPYIDRACPARGVDHRGIATSASGMEGDATWRIGIRWSRKGAAEPAEFLRGES